MRRPVSFFVLLLFWYAGPGWPQASDSDASRPGSRVLVDAHNCYPYAELWSDRIDPALATGTPVAIEQDLAWYTDPRTGRSWSVLSHDGHPTGSEPTMQQ